MNDASIAPVNLPCVLLVEDYDPNILVATVLLEGFGYDCDVAHHGREALEKIKASRHRYVAVLMDVEMPHLDGYQATRLVREEERETGCRRLPIIGMTAHAQAGDREKCVYAGMDDYIAKPFNPEDLRQRLERVISVEK